MTVWEICSTGSYHCSARLIIIFVFLVGFFSQKAASYPKMTDAFSHFPHFILRLWHASHDRMTHWRAKKSVKKLLHFQPGQECTLASSFLNPEPGHSQWGVRKKGTGAVRSLCCLPSPLYERSRAACWSMVARHSVH